MVNKPDLSELTKKIDIGGIVDNIKSMVSPGGGTPDVSPNDTLGLKMAEISLKIQELVASQEQHTKSLSEINKLLNAAFKDLEALREKCSNCDDCQEESSSNDADKKESKSKEDAASKADEDEKSSEKSEEKKA